MLKTTYHFPSSSLLCTTSVCSSDAIQTIHTILYIEVHVIYDLNTWKMCSRGMNSTHQKKLVKLLKENPFDFYLTLILPILQVKLQSWGILFQILFVKKTKKKLGGAA